MGAHIMRTHLASFTKAMVTATLLCPAAAPPAHAGNDANELPIREVTAFKDGHALVLRAGETRTNHAGDVVLSELPRPVLGTFWLETTEDDAHVFAVRAERIEVDRETPVATVDQILRANVNREILFRSNHDASGDLRRGTLRDVVEHRTEPEQPAANNSYWNGHQWINPRAAQPDPVITRLALIEERTEAGEAVTAAIPLDALRDVRITGKPERPLQHTVEDERLTIDLDWTRNSHAESANVSLMYVERGLRWIPSYRVTMLDEGRVRIELQATLVNELADLESATLHLAIGSPSFAFHHTPDPMGMNDNLRDLGFFFRQAPDSATGGMLSNAIMAQSARATEVRQAGGGQGGIAPNIPSSERREDLYVFTIDNVTLPKGARLVLPVTAYETEAKSVYTLDLPASPPLEALQRINYEQQREIARLLNRPSPRHILRIDNTNDAGHPITTAPAMVVKDGLTLAQGLITYTPAGATVDLQVGVAVDITVETSEEETGRDLNGLRWNDDNYARVDVGFEALITNRKARPVTLEVTKLAFGNPVSVSNNGSSRSLSMFDAEHTRSFDGRPWWTSYPWPWYWSRLNGAAEYTWTIDLDAGEDRTVEAAWHYLWR
jgi:hypothetical protein